METRPAFSVATELLRRAADLYDMEPWKIYRAGQKRNNFHVRFAVIWVLRRLGSGLNQKENPYSYPRLAQLLGFDDHSSVIYGFRQAEKLRESNPEFRAITNELLAFATTYGPQVRKAA